MVTGRVGGSLGGLSSRTFWGVDRHYSSECVVGLLRLLGVGVGGLSVSKVSRLSRSGKELAYFQVVGLMTAINSLEAHRHVLKSRSWRVGWGDGVAQRNEWRSRGARRTPAPYRQ